MLLGELLTVVQENLPIKIAVYDNGKLGFVHGTIEHPFHGRKVARGDHKIQLKFMIICI